MPVLPPQDCGLQKYVAVPAWWSLESIVEWLCGQPDAGWLGNAERFRMAATVDERTHVRIDPESLAAAKQKLFSTQGIVIDRLLDPSGKSHPAELVCR
ncbi:MAG: type III-B CRISPR module-associated Cmr3 family protein, partial [Planctomyces sp.]